MRVYFDPTINLTYLTGVDSYGLLKAGVDLELKEYTNKLRNYVNTGSWKLVDHTFISERERSRFIIVNKHNVLSHAGSLPEVVFGVLSHYEAIDKNLYFKLSMMTELLK